MVLAANTTQICIFKRKYVDYRTILPIIIHVGLLVAK